MSERIREIVGPENFEPIQINLDNQFRDLKPSVVIRLVGALAVATATVSVSGDTTYRNASAGKAGDVCTILYPDSHSVVLKQDQKGNAISIWCELNHPTKDNLGSSDEQSPTGRYCNVGSNSYDLSCPQGYSCNPIYPNEGTAGKCVANNQ